jgi:hypothetical protein
MTNRDQAPSTQLEFFPESSYDTREFRIAKSQAISLKRIADSLEKIAARPAIDPQEIYSALTEAGYAVARNIRGQ